MDPDPNWISLQKRYGFVFRIRIRIHTIKIEGEKTHGLKDKILDLIQNFLCLRCFSKIKLFLSVTSQCQRLGSGSPNWVNSQDVEYAVTNFRMMFFTTFFICFS